jgi:arylsulfatase A-like enzyme
VAALAASRLLHGPWVKRFVRATATACVVLLAGEFTWTLRLDAPPPLPAQRQATSASKGPNVLLVVLDTVRADHLSVYGYGRRTTPNLEVFARESVLYRNAVSAADMTLSSYGAMYTGLYPSWHGAVPNPTSTVLPLDGSFVTLAETLSANGYVAAAVAANHGYLNREFGMQQGFEHYDVRPPVAAAGIGREYWLRNALRPLIELVVSTAEWDRAYRRSDQITGNALRILASRNQSSAPFFLSVNYMDAHEPYLPPAASRELISFRNAGTRRTAATSELRAELAAHHRTPQTQAAVDDLNAQYDSAIAYMDEEIHRLLEGLRKTGLYDNTLIIVTSDHGEALGERDALGHPVSVHQELVHVPLLVKYPRSAGMPGGQQEAAVVSGLDLLPTVLDLAGIPLPVGIQGRSLRSSADPERLVFSESFVDGHLSQNHLRSDRGQRAVYQGPWKLISTVNGASELYDWRADPQETQNLYAANHPSAMLLTDQLALWLQRAPRRNSSMKKMDQQTLDRLRGLGYVK